MAMTAGQFFLYLLIIIILKESLASATAMEAESSSSSSTSSGFVASEGSWPIGEDGSSMVPAVNMGVRVHAQPAHPFVRGKLICFTQGECFTIPGVRQYYVELSRRWGWGNS